MCVCVHVCVCIYVKECCPWERCCISVHITTFLWAMIGSLGTWCRMWWTMCIVLCNQCQDCQMLLISWVFVCVCVCLFGLVCAYPFFFSLFACMDWHNNVKSPKDHCENGKYFKEKGFILFEFLFGLRLKLNTHTHTYIHTLTYTLKQTHTH